MYAAMKDDCFAYVIFIGGAGSDYPKWFWSFMEEYIYMDEYNYYSMGDCAPWPDHLVEGQDVFVRNRTGEIKHITLEEFQSIFVDLGQGACALPQDVMEYVTYTGEYDIYPEWFIADINDHGIVTKAFDFLGEPHVRGIFVRNKFGEIAPMHEDEFYMLCYGSKNAESIHTDLYFKRRPERNKQWQRTQSIF